MKELENYFTKGILDNAFQAERNLIIWKKIADEVDFLNRQSKEIQQLYSFIQLAASTNIVLYTAKLFDKPKNNPTRCILSFLELIKSKSKNLPKIVETTGTIKILKDYKSPKDLINSVEYSDTSLFPLQFYNYYKTKYDSSEIKEKISNLKDTRDKMVAHSEVLNKQLDLELQNIEDLLSFALEIISIFGMAYYSTIYGNREYSFLTRDADRGAYFIEDNINSLKKEKLCIIK